MMLSDEPMLYVAGGLFLAWNIVLTILFWRIIGHYQRLVGKTRKGNMEAVLNTLLEQADKKSEKIADLEDKITKISKEIKNDYQKSAVVKYNPFSDSGGNQSFSLVVLNGDNNGFMVTSLHGRDSTRVYSKLIVDGKAESGNLSKEEQLAVKNALGGKSD
jgi:hypothetical protein